MAGRARPQQVARTQELEPTGEQGAGLDDGGVALRACGDHANFDLEIVGDEAEIVYGGFRQLGGVFEAVGGFAPAREGFVDGRDPLVDFGGSGHFVDGRAFVRIAHTHPDFALGVEDVKLGNNERIDAVDHFCVAEYGQIEPAAAAGASCDGAKFFATLTNFLGFKVGHFGGERTSPDARSVGLGNAKHVANLGRGNAHARGGAAGCCAGGGDEGISSVVNVEHGALCTFEEDGLAFVEGAIGEFGGVADVGFDFFAEAEGFFHFVREIHVCAIGSLRDTVFFSDNAGGLFAEEIRVEQIHHAQSAARHFVFVGGANAARSGADFIFTAGGFGGFVQFAVIGEDQMGAIADVQAAGDAEMGLFEHFNFGNQGGRIDDDAGTDDDMLLGSQVRAAEELKNVAVLADDNRVAGVMAPGDASDVIERAGEIINDFALAFIAPLRTNHHDRFHSEILLDRRDTRILSAKSTRHTNLKSYDGLVRNASDGSERNFRKLKRVA